MKMSAKIELPLLTELSALASRAAREAGALLIERIGNVAVTRKDTGHNLLTEADLASQKLIVDLIRMHFPDHGIIAEENGLDDRNREGFTWIIDPLDGTMNYAHGFPHFSVSIACCYKGEPVVGVVYNPVLNELFSAIAGDGARCNGGPVSVSSKQDVENSLVMTGFYYDRGSMTTHTLAAIGALFAVGMGDMRRSGSAALDLCYVAAGRIDAYFEYNLSVWDFAAGMLLVREAGGVVSDRYGAQMTLEGRGVIVSNGHFHDRLVDLLRYPQ